MTSAVYMVVDEKYASVAAVSGMYIARNFDQNVHIFIETDGFFDINRYQHCKLHFHFNELSKFLPQNLPSSDKWPTIVYYRIFVPSCLPGYDRLLYVDADVAMMGGIEELWDLDLRGQTLAAVQDTGMLGPMAPGLEIPTRQWLANIGIQSSSYFNSGILLIDVKKWIENDFSSLLKNYFRKFGRFVRMWDQDFLNYTFQGKWVELSPRWNYQITLFNFGFEKFFQPRLVHFTDGRKPWHWTSFDWDVRYIDFYKTLCANAGVDLSELPKPNYDYKRVSIRRAKWKVRSVLSFFGIRSNKAAHKRWQELRAIYINFFERSISEQRFADMPLSSRFLVEDVRLVFNGRILVCKHAPIKRSEIYINRLVIAQQDR